MHKLQSKQTVTEKISKENNGYNSVLNALQHDVLEMPNHYLKKNMIPEELNKL